MTLFRPAAACLALASLALTAAALPARALELRPVAEGLTAPIDLVDPGDGSGRLFVLEQQGLVRVIESGVEATGVGTAETGARIYRGSAIPRLAGKLVFADWSAAFERPSGQLFVATPAPSWGAQWPFETLMERDSRIVGLAEDGAGELYVLTNDNLGPFGSTDRVLKLVP
jgi:glucose/arabinose dehydrogenase